MGIKTFLHGPMEYAKTLELRFRIGNLDLPKRSKRYANSREEKEDAKMSPCGKAIKSRTGLVGGREIYKEQWDVLRARRDVSVPGPRVSGDPNI